MIATKSSCLPLLILFLVWVGVPSYAEAEQTKVVFSTWNGFEIDKCASIWLIKRFVNENAVIKFYPKGENLKEGIPFDTPDAKLRRYHNMSTFESILKYYNLQDPGLVYIGKIVHDIEVNIWERKVLNETMTVQDTVNELITNSTDNDEIIGKTSKYFDFLYLSLSN